MPSEHEGGAGNQLVDPAGGDVLRSVVEGLSSSKKSAASRSPQKDLSLSMTQVNPRLDSEQSNHMQAAATPTLGQIPDPAQEQEEPSVVQKIEKLMFANFTED